MPVPPAGSPEREPPALGSSAPTADPPRLSWRRWLGIWLALQVGAALPLVAAFVLLGLVAPLFGPGAGGFTRSWLAAFVLVPVTYVPALVRWHTWTLRANGRHPRMYRLLAEVAFAVEVIACVLGQRIA